MSAKNFDRDLQFINVFEDTPGQSTSFPDKNSAPLPRTDGTVYDDVGTFVSSDMTDISLAANKQNAAGVIMRRPEVRGVYRIRGFIYVDTTLDPNLFVSQMGIAVAPASPTAAATGEVVPHWQFLKTCTPGDPTIDLTVCIDNFGTISSTDYSARDIIFYASFANNANVTSIGIYTYNISVQRLSVGVPEYESKYR